MKVDFSKNKGNISNSKFIGTDKTFIDMSDNQGDINAFEINDYVAQKNTTQFNHYGNGDQIAGDKFATPNPLKKSKRDFWFWAKRVSVALVPIGGLIWAIIIRQPNEIIPMSNQFNHYGDGDQVAGDKYVINTKPKQRHLNEEDRAIFAKLSKEKKINLFSILGDSEAITYADEVNDYLKTQGYNIESYGLISGPISGSHINDKQENYEIIIGSNNL